MIDSMNKGILMVLVSALLFSLGGLFTKMIPWEGFSISSGRCIFSSLFFVAYFLIQKKKLKINKMTIIGAILVCANMTCYIECNKLTTAANTIILEYVAPIYIVIFNMLFRKRRPRGYEIVVSASVLLGVILVLAGDLGKGNSLGNIIALFSGVIYAFVIMLNEFEGGDSMTSMLLGHIMCIFIGFPSLLAETDFSFKVVASVIMFGTLITGGGYFFLSLGTKHCDSLTASIVACVEPILNPIFVLLFYGEKLSSLTIAGALIVISSIVAYNVLMKKEMKVS